MMLQTNNLPVPSTVQTHRPEYDAGSVVEAFQAMLGLLRRHWPIFIIAALIPLLLAGAYIYVTPPTYTATATMVLDGAKVHAYQHQQSSVVDEPSDAITVQTQVEVLKSDAIAMTVVKNLQLATDPEFVGNPAGLSQEQAEHLAAQAFIGRYSVARVPATYVIEIGVQSRDPEKAARIANAVVDSYATDQLDAKFQATRRASAWLQDRLSELNTQASAADKAVADFKAKNNIVAVDGRLMNEQQLGEVNSQLIAAKGASAEAKARLDRITEVINQPLPDASVAEGLHSEIIVRLRQQILDLTARESVFATRYGAKHQATLNLLEEIAGARRSIADEMRKIADSAKSDYAIAQAREAALKASFNSSVDQSESTNQSLVHLRELQSTAQSSRALYDSFLQRSMDAAQQESFPSTEARLITPAVRPGAPSKPNRTGILGAALSGGVLIGFGVALLRELTDGVFRSAKQVESKLQVTCLTTIPAIKARPLLAGPPKQQGTLREIAASPTLYRYVIEEPFSSFSEGLRAIKIAADLANVSKRHSVLGVTSTLPNEGKSTISANFAHLIAHSGGRVLLVDADLRNPSLSRLFAPGSDGGLVDLIAGRRRMVDVVWSDSDSHLDFLPAGAPHKLMHTTEILASEGARAFFEAARAHYDYVIVDLAPLAPVVDTRTTTHFIDSYIYALEWGRTKVDVVSHVLGDAREIHEAILGVVLNKADLSILGRYERHRGRSYHRKYYKRYGYIS